MTAYPSRYDEPFEWTRRCHICGEEYPERKMWKVWDQGERWLCNDCIANWDKPERGEFVTPRAERG